MGLYQNALDYIYSYVDYEKVTRFSHDAETLNLGRMRELLDRVGRPQERFRSVHIAGTKGKGSTSAMIESVLRAAGYRTGLYTSPHLHTFRERIRTDGDLMPKAAVVELVGQVRPAAEAMTGVTTFEIMTALAFTYFARQGVEWAILETGLGGRLDATNVVDPAVCAITSISFDHVDLLGHALESIAREKAGIIKAGVPLVSAPQAPEAMAVIEDACAEKGAPLIRAGVDWIATGQSADLSGQTMTLHRTNPPLTLPDIRIALLGEHQLDNTTVAAAMLDELAAQGVTIPEKALRTGLAKARWPGRFELLSARPVIVVDGAHNADSAHKLRATLATFFPRTPGCRLAMVFGASTDKDIAGMLQEFLSSNSRGAYLTPERVIVTRSGHPRQADPARLAKMVFETCPDCQVDVRDSLEAAMADALGWASEDDMICVTGSLFVVAQARLAWARYHPEVFAATDWVFQDETPGQCVPDDDTALKD